MKTALYGRIVFGASAVLFGIIALMWHDSDTLQNLQQIWRLPFGTLIGGCLMTAQIAGGLGYSTRAPRAWLRSYFALSICVSRWLVSLTSLPHRTSMSDTVGASSCSFPYSAARLRCTLRLRQMQQGR